MPINHISNNLTSIGTFIFAFVFPHFIWAQEHDYYQYTVADGLPTNYVYGVIEDDDGYIWAYTENGMAKFDGYQFQHFSTEDGLPGNDVIQCLKDKDGRLWLDIYGLQAPAYIKGDSVVVFEDRKYSPSPAMHLVDGYITYKLEHYFFQYGKEGVKKISYWRFDSLLIQKFPDYFQIDSIVAHENMTIEERSSFYRNSRKTVRFGKDSTYFLNKIDMLNEVFYSYERNDFNIFFIPLIAPERAANEMYWLDGQHWSSFSFPELLFRNYNNYPTEKIPNEEAFLMAFDQKNYYWIKPKAKSIQTLGFEVSDMGSVSYVVPKLLDSSLFFSTNFGFFQYDYEGKLLDKLSTESISQQYFMLSSFKDSKGNIWIGSREAGLFMIPAQKRKTRLLSSRVSDDQAFEQIIRTEQGEILAFTDNTGIYLVQDDSLINLILPDRTIRFRAAQQTSMGIIISSGKGFVMDNDLNIKAFEEVFLTNLESLDQRTFSRQPCIAYDEINEKLYGGRVLIYAYDVSNPKNVKMHTININSTQLHFHSGQNTLYIGNNEGIYILDDQQAVPFLDRLKDISVLSSTEKQLWIGTENSGLWTYDFCSKALYQISKAAYIRQIRPYQEGSWLIACNEGILVVDSLKEQHRYTVEDGLFSNEIRDVNYDGERYIYVANSEGLLQLDTWWKDEAKLPKDALQITHILVNEKPINTDTFLQLAHHQNTLEFKYRLLSFESNKNIQYLSKLEPLEDEWRISAMRHSFYLSLPPNNYKFHLKARDAYGNEIELSPLSLIIRPAFWQTIWFQVLLIVLVLGALIAYIWNLRYQQKQKILAERTRLEKEKHLNNYIVEAKLSTLRAQMNPHFVFNALASIQYYIQDNKKDVAEEYLASFAALMRKYLNSSKTHFITLKDEIELLRLYTDLEQMRFEGHFEVNFFISQDLLVKDISIPSMLIQPYVENAIKHGLHPRKDQEGELNIHFSEQGNTLYCRIEDNGVGISNSRKRKKEKSLGSGLSIIQEKIVTLRQSELADVSVVIDDLAAANERFPGTAVEIVIKTLQNERI
ncbi:MAG: histidine kinase [Bacteroidota bacterium]